MRIHPIWHAGYWEWEALLFGAVLIALGAGALLGSLLASIAGTLIVVGIPMHVWGMYRVYRQNPTPHETIHGFESR